MKPHTLAFVVTALPMAITACHENTFDRVQAELVGEKRGRVVDANGLALSNVKVVATYDNFHRGLNGSDMSCTFQRVATTDANGDYAFPKETHSPISSNEESKGVLRAVLTNDYSKDDLSWRLIVFKQGYVIAEDAKALTTSKYLPGIGFGWEGGVKPNAAVVDSVVHIDPIEMTEEHLSGAQQIVLYDRLNSALQCSPMHAPDREVEAIRQQILDDALGVPCSMQSEEVVGGEIVKTFANLTKGRVVWDALVKLGEPSSGADWHELSAGQICGASMERKGE